MKLFTTVWLFMTSMLLIGLGLKYGAIEKFDIWPLVILWGAVCFLIAALRLVNEQYPDWWK